MRNRLRPPRPKSTPLSQPTSHSKENNTRSPYIPQPRVTDQSPQITKFLALLLASFPD
ncbi:hypothetical protein BJ508DRAFT_419869 [Ascobolus immersus RN42]|uniref:Uncharacterized protein n=1 Tax=Ascobolus immersus RN42 TaxID=1160509 RepID=A0A3N4HPI5_ASCIM|nr:hypothetical protein BJ508DRAFT_419869 [Ascobolus immersus RN42]